VFKERIVILDGGMGTQLQTYKLEEADYRGKSSCPRISDIKYEGNCGCFNLLS